MYSPISLTEAIFEWQYLKKILPITAPFSAAKPLQKGAVDLLACSQNCFRKIAVASCYSAIH